MEKVAYIICHEDRKPVKCVCCGTEGLWWILAREGKGRVCKKCYDFINAPIGCSEYDTAERIEKNLIRLCKAVITTAGLDYLYLRRYELSNQKLCKRREREILKNGGIAKGFFGDITGEFSKYCSIANLIPEEARERLKCFTIEDINDILGELGK